MDRYRPRYHFTPPANWMNDPNGPFQLNGEYHLFYQHNPSAPVWGDIHWGHAKSKDLIHWERLPIALAPSVELGELHCYSGCSVVDGEEVRLFYTSIGEGERNATTGAQQWTVKGEGNDLLAWRKPGEINPLLTTELHGDLQVTEWRDPYVWKEQDEWRMLLGGTYEGRGCALIYQSADLENWTFNGIFHLGEETIFECPHLFRFGDRAVLFYSPSSPVQYVSGVIRDNKLSGELVKGTVDFGGWDGYYASTGFVDEKGRRILHGWVPESRGENFPVALDWAGALALPRIGELKENGKLSITPIPEAETLRGESRTFTELRVGASPLDTGVRSTAFECSLTIQKPAAGTGELIVSVLASACGRERTELRVDFAGGTVAVDRTQSSLFPEVRKTALVGALNLDDAAETINLRFFVDQSIIEVFAGDETCITARVYPSLDDSSGIHLQAIGEVHIAAMEIWELKAAEIHDVK
ncbi:glycoside hydrolase family 32 protein [Paenibacillus montanisoli]|uniref:beta-fructofuranosidase n=1 Tax=Paenibacillus montanisoli TaxID=2081970 RepID=A0A328TVF9_9BACL|nr:glycoside hydrolase family 32 protein [Paenibacillus montanisoli]RAP73612.1 glycoside hydrolase family 32 protein [Paenibacillus montanisoli]